MHALVVMAHGSRAAVANDEVRALAAWLEADGAAARVVAAFLELAEPSLPDAITALAAEGARSVRVLPFFLNSGRHVGRDVPALVEAARAAHPALVVEVLPHVGAGDAFRAFVRQQV